MNKHRLIDANALKDIITGSEEFIDWQKKEICECIDCCDIAYNLDGVVEQLEREEHRAVVNYHNSRGLKVAEAYGQRVAFERATEIVKGNCSENPNSSDQFTDVDKMGGGAE